ncbi:ATP-binding protein [Actinosynnema sp. NPDC047251]|uniref:histidine kinase n=1 Tax=Saccharothrix espanaensis (strain ATCC 51144 / DSM 44229 / JCM 9112 / NBRC 15066 / NRRL 15764) TaxID=1179773 RepID=K0K551_SACES|nr:ATP-binding protein [Saccharothrix espanaensis]CCH31989.1 putative sensor-like histidine kinase [Saccharothrix espanaensis DSM 44229]
MRSLVDQYRKHGARSLLDQARGTVVEFLEPRREPRHAATPGTPSTAAAPAALAEPTGARRDDVLSDVFAGIALRDLNLVDSLLAELERMEAEEQDPDALARLYKLDHLATRLRRNAENLRVLAGEEAGAATGENSSLVDVVRAALSAIEQYRRVEIGRVAQLAVVGLAADDVSRLLTELLDNATAQSPPHSTVTVSAHFTEQGSVLVRVEDSGIGLPAQRLAELNDRLSTAPVLDRAAVGHMGLAVVRRLADKHGLRVWLDDRVPHGTIACVLLPAGLVREAPQVSFTRRAEPASRVPAEVPDARRPALDSRRPAPDAPRATGVTAGVTDKGLPRRVPTSLRGGGEPAPPRPRDLATGPDVFDDLTALGEGERAARGTLPDEHPDAHREEPTE